ncbi:MAG: hypothetical protein ACD_22C00283G0009 [uncultured bacterium]|nr:MAG: hypothetical protein ACD_22C00283G0009 [uncultured bacterium]
MENLTAVNTNGVEITRTEEFKTLWDCKANLFNKLAREMTKKGIPASRLREVVEAVQDVERLFINSVIVDRRFL